MKLINKSMVIGCMALSSACSSISNSPYIQEKGNTAIKTPYTATYATTLSALPEPAGRLVVAIYQFTDQTGQYKEGQGSSSFSTAVTQGATPILIQSLQESGWFEPLEREGLQNILTERKIIRAAANKTNNQKNSLPPLAQARIMLEGGITGYDSNIRTGGSGLEYFGVSASNQYREDFITVHLRAIDVYSGKVLISVSASRRVLSQEIRGGLYRFVKFKRLLGIETGLTHNEPSHIAVTEAIEKAISDLIIEGILRQLWNTKNAEDRQSPIIMDYKKEINNDMTMAEERAKKS